MLPKTPGIYRIENIVNGRCYIGQTYNMHKRWGDHKSALRCGYAWNVPLQTDWDVFGPDAFICIVLRDIPPDRCMDTVERYYIEDAINKGVDLYNPPGTVNGVKKRKFRLSDIDFGCHHEPA